MARTSKDKPDYTYVSSPIIHLREAINTLPERAPERRKIEPILLKLIDKRHEAASRRMLELSISDMGLEE